MNAADAIETRTEFDLPSNHSAWVDAGSPLPKSIELRATVSGAGAGLIVYVVGDESEAWVGMVLDGERQVHEWHPERVSLA